MRLKTVYERQATATAWLAKNAKHGDVNSKSSETTAKRNNNSSSSTDDNKQLTRTHTRTHASPFCRLYNNGPAGTHLSVGRGHLLIVRQTHTAVRELLPRRPAELQALLVHAGVQRPHAPFVRTLRRRQNDVQRAALRRRAVVRVRVRRRLRLQVLQRLQHATLVCLEGTAQTIALLARC